MPQTVARYLTLGEAEAAVSALEAAGIQCSLGRDNIVTIQWLYANAVGWIEVTVADEDLEKAEEVLSSEAIVEEPLPEPSDAAEAHCPHCGSTDIHRVFYRRFGAVPLLLAPLSFLLVPFFLFMPRWKCDRCGRRARSLR